MKSAWLRSSFSLAAFVPSLMLIWPCSVSLQGAEPGQNSFCQEELNRYWATLHLGGLFCWRVLVYIPSHPGGMGENDIFMLFWHSVKNFICFLGFCWHFRICFRCSLIHEIHSCLWVSFLLNWGSSSKPLSLWQLLTIAEQQPPLLSQKL